MIKGSRGRPKTTGTPLPPGFCLRKYDWMKSLDGKGVYDALHLRSILLSSCYSKYLENGFSVRDLFGLSIDERSDAVVTSYKVYGEIPDVLNQWFEEGRQIGVKFIEGSQEGKAVRDLQLRDVQDMAEYIRYLPDFVHQAPFQSMSELFGDEIFGAVVEKVRGELECDEAQSKIELFKRYKLNFIKKDLAFCVVDILRDKRRVNNEFSNWRNSALGRVGAKQGVNAKILRRQIEKYKIVQIIDLKLLLGPCYGLEYSLEHLKSLLDLSQELCVNDLSPYLNGVMQKQYLQRLLV